MSVVPSKDFAYAFFGPCFSTRNSKALLEADLIKRDAQVRADALEQAIILIESADSKLNMLYFRDMIRELRQKGVANVKA